MSATSCGRSAQCQPVMWLGVVSCHVSTACYHSVAALYLFQVDTIPIWLKYCWPTHNMLHFEDLHMSPQKDCAVQSLCVVQYKVYVLCSTKFMCCVLIMSTIYFSETTGWNFTKLYQDGPYNQLPIFVGFHEKLLLLWQQGVLYNTIDRE